MYYLPESLKIILNALAVQHAGNGLNEKEKQANLARVLQRIAQEQQGGDTECLPGQPFTPPVGP
ncbi:MAG: hypothetical protein R3E89_19850 [Thiolinea sp.]